MTGEISGTDVTLAGTGFRSCGAVRRGLPRGRRHDRGPGPERCADRVQRPVRPGGHHPRLAEYVVVAGIIEGESRWANRDAVPVITNHNPFYDVIVPVTAVTPPDEAWGPFGLGWLGWLIVLAIIGLIVAVAIWYWRSRQEPPPDLRGVPRTLHTDHHGDPPDPPAGPTGGVNTAVYFPRVDNHRVAALPCADGGAAVQRPHPLLEPRQGGAGWQSWTSRRSAWSRSAG